MFSRSGTVLPAIVICCILGCLAACKPSRKKPQAGSSAGAAGPGALDIKLVGVRPDGGDDLLDATGKKIGELPEYSHGPDSWRDWEMRRDFIFEIPATTRTVFVSSHQEIRLAGEDISVSWYAMSAMRRMKGGERLVLPLRIRREHRRRFLRFFKIEKPVESVDLVLRYYHGPPGKADVVFNGPFFPGVKVRPEDGRAVFLTPRLDRNTGFNQFDAQLRLTTGLAVKMQVLAYDRQGRRHKTDPATSRSGPEGVTWTGRVRGLPLERIKMITVGERPQEITFKNIRVAYPDRPPRRYAEYRDRIAERLQLTDLTETYIRQFQLKTPQRAVRVADLVRGNMVQEAAKMLFYSGSDFRLSQLSDEDKERVRAAARAWTKSSDVTPRMYGLRLGLRGGWREFFDPALDLLNAEGEPYARMEVAGALADGFRKQLLPADRDRIQVLLLKRDDPAIFISLFRVFRHDNTPEGHERLWRFARDDRPWLWWNALEWLSTYHAIEDPGALPHEMKLRLILVRGPDAVPEGERMAPEAYAMLPGVLTVKMALMNFGITRILRMCCERLDRKTATAALIDLLRDCERYRRAWWSGEDEDLGAWFHPGDPLRKLNNVSVQAVKWINRLNDVDIGGVGDDLSAGRDFHPGLFSRGLAGEAIRWYETGRLNGELPSGYSPKRGDLRIVWRNLKNPENSRIAASRMPETPVHNPPVIRLRSDRDLVALQAFAAETDEGLRFMATLQTGILSSRSSSRRLEFALNDLPDRVTFARVDPDAIDTNGFGQGIYPYLWEGEWELWIERLDAPESVIKGTKVFEDWIRKLNPPAE